MAKLIPLIASRDFRHLGKLVKRGEPLNVGQVDAVVLTYAGKAILASRLRARPMPNPILDKIPDALDPSSGTDGGPQDAAWFARPSMQGEPGQVAIHVPILPPEPPVATEDSPAPEPAPERESGGSPAEDLPKLKRRYRRRDLEAETDPIVSE